jgi:hypothetical protein
MAMNAMFIEPDPKARLRMLRTFRSSPARAHVFLAT